MVVDGHDDVSTAEDDKVPGHVRLGEVHRETEEEGFVVTVVVRAAVPDFPSFRRRRHFDWSRYLLDRMDWLLFL